MVVGGRLRVRDWERDGRKGTTVVIDARTVGHDLSRGTAAFKRHIRGTPATPVTDVFDEIVATIAGAEPPTAAEPAA